MIDVNRILQELETIKEFRDRRIGTPFQLMLQGTQHQSDPNYGTGRITDIDADEKEFVYPLFSDIPYTNMILNRLQMFRARISVIPPKYCFSWHRDYTHRIHVPLITHNRQTFMVVGEEVVRMKAGQYHIVDTTEYHTAVNGWSKDRVHIIAGTTLDKTNTGIVI
jgi:hypothetical protein